MERRVIIEFDSVEDAIAADESPAYQEALSPSPTARSRAFASLGRRLEALEGRTRSSPAAPTGSAPSLRTNCATRVRVWLCTATLQAGWRSAGRTGSTRLPSIYRARMGSGLVVAFALLAASRPLFFCPLRVCSDPHASSGGPV